MFSNLSAENGLINNQTEAIFQDHQGYMWIGTQAGLQRYDGIRFKTYLANVRDSNSLQSDWISTIFEDSKHRLWIGSDKGAPYLLNRQTNKFYNFNLHLSTKSTSINGVWQFFEDSKHTIWMIAHDAVYKLNETSFQFEHANKEIGLPENAFPSSMNEDEEHTLWFCTTDGIKCLSLTSHEIFSQQNNPKKLACFNIPQKISSVCFDTHNFIWISTGFDRVLYRYSKITHKLKGFEFKSIGDRLDEKLTSTEFLGNPIFTSTDELMIPILSRGIAYFDYKKDCFKISEIDHANSSAIHINQHAFSGLSLYEDRDQSIWITTDEGISRTQLNATNFESILPNSKDAKTSPSAEVSDCVQMLNGDIFISFYDSKRGIECYDEQLNFKRSYRIKGLNKSEVLSNQIWSMYKDEKETIWASNQFGTISKITSKKNSVHIFRNSDLEGNITQIEQDNQHQFWFANYQKGLQSYNQFTNITSTYHEFQGKKNLINRVQCFLFDHEKIWVGTFQHGLQCFDSTLKIFTHSYIFDINHKNSISNNTITGLLEFNQDTLIVATLGGINIFNKRTQTFKTISSRDGLPNNLVQAITLDSNKLLWVAFAGGLSSINVRTLQILSFTKEDGILYNRLNHRFTQLKDGRLIIGASSGLLAFNPFLMNKTTHPTRMAITDFMVNGESYQTDSLINTTKFIELSHNENHLFITFSSMQYFKPNHLIYSYKLDGLNDEWHLANADQRIEYNELNPGKYTLIIKCVNQHQPLEFSVSKLSFEIHPPFWQSGWFYSLIMIVMISIVVLFIKRRESQIRLIAESNTSLQKLTAEKYKSQFESEKISSFFTTSLMNKNNVDDLLWDVAKNLIGQLGFVDCMIYLWNDQQNKLIQKAGYGFKGSKEDLIESHFDVEIGQGIVGAVASSGEPIVIHDTSIDTRYRVDDIQRLSEICIPIKYGNELLGVIDCEHPEKNFFTHQHLQLLTTISTLVASKLKSIESAQQLQQQQVEIIGINQQLAEVQLAALRSQMNPHFIFNALNSIKKFVVANEAVDAAKYLGKFSKLIRNILDNSRSGTITIEKEMQLLALYLDLEQLRFGQHLTYSIEINTTLNQNSIRIPSMIIQPFVENAILHGIMHSHQVGHIQIQFNMHDEWMQVDIIDNGIGRVQSAEYNSSLTEKHESLGIEVAAKRIQSIQRNNAIPAGIDIIDLYNHLHEASGTHVIIKIPY